MLKHLLFFLACDKAQPIGVLIFGSRMLGLGKALFIPGMCDIGPPPPPASLVLLSTYIDEWVYICTDSLYMSLISRNFAVYTLLYSYIVLHSCKNL